MVNDEGMSSHLNLWTEIRDLLREIRDTNIRILASGHSSVREQRYHSELLEKVAIVEPAPKTKANRNRQALLRDAQRFIIISSREGLVPTYTDIAGHVGVAVSTVSDSKYWKPVRDTLADLKGERKEQGELPRGYQKDDGDVEACD